jgi:hypothetical protein
LSSKKSRRLIIAALRGWLQGSKEEIAPAGKTIAYVK